MQHLAFTYYLAQEPITFLKAPLKVVGSSDNQIQGKGWIKHIQNLNCFIYLISGRHDHQHVHVTEPMRFAISIGAKEKDFIWLKILDNPFGDAKDCGSGHPFGQIWVGTILVKELVLRLHGVIIINNRAA
jgi:hypothetical protein